MLRPEQEIRERCAELRMTLKDPMAVYATGYTAWVAELKALQWVLMKRKVSY